MVTKFKMKLSIQKFSFYINIPTVTHFITHGYTLMLNVKLLEIQFALRM